MPSSRRASSADRRYRILLVDDHSILREGVATQINQEPDLVVCGEATNARDALTAADQLEPDLVLVDLTLPGRHGLELIRDLLARRARLPVLVLSMHDPFLFAERVLRAGGRGFISKQEGGRELIGAIRHVLAGEIYLSKDVSTHLLDGLAQGAAKGIPPSPVEALTDRELEVFSLIGQAQETKRIAQRLGMSARTVEVHRANIKRKLGLRSGTELVRHAVLWFEAAG